MVITTPIALIVLFVVAALFVSNLIHWSKVSTLREWNLTVMEFLILALFSVPLFFVPIIWAKALGPKTPKRTPYYDNSDNWGV